MKNNITLVLLLLSFVGFAQNASEKAAVERACLNYLEGFYEGDTAKLVASVKPTLHKFGFMRKGQNGAYRQVAPMTFEGAKNYALSVKEKQQFPAKDAPKEVEVLDIMNHLAAAKVTAWWGQDYLLLSKVGDKWMIEQVLWEGPL